MIVNLFLVVLLAPIFVIPLIFCMKKKSETKTEINEKEIEIKKKEEMRIEFDRKWAHITKKKKEMEEDLLLCPKSSGKGECNVEHRMYGYVTFSSEEYRKMIVDEEKMFGNSEKLENNRKQYRNEGTIEFDYTRADLECKVSRDYLPKIKQAMEACAKHSPDEEKLRIYHQAYVDKVRYFATRGESEFEYKIHWTTFNSINFKMPPNPEEFWERALHDEYFGLDGFIEVSKAAAELMKKRGLFVDCEPLDNAEKKKDEGDKNLTKNGSKNLESVEKMSKEGSVEKIEKDEKDGKKSIENDDKKSAENEKREGEKTKKSAKSGAAVTEKKKESKEVNDGSEKKEEGSKNGSKTKPASKKDNDDPASKKNSSADK